MYTTSTAHGPFTPTATPHSPFIPATVHTLPSLQPQCQTPPYRPSHHTPSFRPGQPPPSFRPEPQAQSRNPEHHNPKPKPAHQSGSLDARLRGHDSQEPIRLRAGPAAPHTGIAKRNIDTGPAAAKNTLPIPTVHEPVMFSGSITALVTPFRNGALDETALAEMVEWQVEQGTRGLVPVGTTGETSTLTEAEHKRVIQITIEAAKGRVPVIAGAGSNNPKEAIEYTRFAEELGAQATLHVAGYYNRPSQEGLFQHYRRVHDATNIPIVLYNIPPRAVVEISLETLIRLSALPRIVGVKDATGDLSRPGRERIRVEQPFCFLSGEDATALAYNAMGGQGCISVTSNVAPALCAEMQQHCLSGDYEAARAIQDKLMPLHEILFAEPSPAGAKFAASLLGFCTDECRMPIMPLSRRTKEAIERIMADLNLKR